MHPSQRNPVNRVPIRRPNEAHKVRSLLFQNCPPPVNYPYRAAPVPAPPVRPSELPRIRSTIPSRMPPSVPITPSTGDRTLDLVGLSQDSALVREVRRLLWVQISIQDHPTWALLDTGSVANIVSRDFYESLSICPTPLPTFRDQLISGHNTALPVVGEVVLPFKLFGQSFFHSFRVVKNFPVPLCIGAEFLRPHKCSINYSHENEQFVIGDTRCPTCLAHVFSLAKPPRGRAVSFSKSGLPIADAPIVFPSGYPRPRGQNQPPLSTPQECSLVSLVLFSKEPPLRLTPRQIVPTGVEFLP